MGSTYLLDTNIVIYILNGTLDIHHSEDLQEAAKSAIPLSIISKMELLSWDAPNEPALAALQNLVNNAVINSLTDDIVEETIAIRRSKKLKLPDATIAATAIANNHILLTRNISDFQKIEGLAILNPFPSS